MSSTAALAPCDAITCREQASTRFLLNEPHLKHEQARKHVQYAISTVVAHFFMDQAAAAAVVRQRGVEVSEQIAVVPITTFVG